MRCTVLFIFSFAHWVSCAGLAYGTENRIRPYPLPEEFFPALREILETRLSGSPQVLEQILREEESREESGVMRAARYPSVRGSARIISRYEERSDLDNGRGGFQPQAALTFRQPVYHWGSLMAEDRIGRIRQELARKNGDEAFRLLALEVRSRYLEMVVGNSAREVAKRRREVTEREWRAAGLQLDRGEIEEVVLRDLEMAFEEADLELERMKMDQQRSLRSLNRLLGIALDYEWEIPDVIRSLDLEFEDQSEAPAAGIASRSRPPFLQAADQRVAEAEGRREAERSRARPNLDLVAGMVQDQVAVFDRQDIDRTIFFAGIEVNWNIFDGFEARSRRAAARSRLRLEESRLQRLENEWHDDLEYLENRLEFNRLEMNLSDQRLDLAEESHERARTDFEAGRLSEIELSRGELRLAETTFEAVRKRAAYLMAWAELVSESGRDPVVLRFARGRQ